MYMYMYMHVYIDRYCTCTCTLCISGNPFLRKVQCGVIIFFLCIHYIIQEHDLEKSMVELAYLGSLLGMPNILDPAFPLAYATFFGSLPSTEEEMEQGAANMGIGEGRIKVEPGTDQHVHDPAYVHASNVSLPVYMYYYDCVYVNLCTCMYMHYLP